MQVGIESFSESYGNQRTSSLYSAVYSLALSSSDHLTMNISVILQSMILDVNFLITDYLVLNKAFFLES